MRQESTMDTLEFGSPQQVDGSLSDNIRGLVGSEILKIASRIREMVAEGRKVCNLTVGDFDAKQFPIPAAWMAEIHKAFDAGHTNYPPSDGVLELRRAITDYVAREWGPRYPVDSVLISSGARPILYSAYRAIVNPGDKVIYPVPSWNNNHYTWMTQAEGVVVPTRPEDGFMPTLDELAPHLKEARLLSLNSPLNPTGTVIGADQLRGIVEAIVDENRRRLAANRPALFLLHDQIYAALVFGKARHHMPVELVPESAPWVISLDGVSKCFAATGLRVGWVTAAPALVSRMKAMIGHVGAWAPRPEQVALAKFLSDADGVHAFQKDMNERVRQRLQALYDGFSKMEADGYPVRCIAPQGAIYLSLQLDMLGKSWKGRPLRTNESIRQLLLDEAAVGVVPFQAFGLEDESGWFRLSVGAVSLEDIDQMFPRLRGLFDDVE